MKKIRINNKWNLKVADHKVDRGNWDTWEFNRLREMRETIKKGDVVFDIGAEEGDLSCLFARWIGNGVILLVEPSELLFPCIKQTFEANNINAEVWSFSGFICDEGKTGEVVKGFPECADGEIDPNMGFRHLSEDRTTPRMRLDDLLDFDYIPNVITIDVEGAELEVLRSGIELLERYKPTVFLSIHKDFMLERYHSSPEQIFRLMRGMGYHDKYLGTDHEIHYKFY